MTWWRWLVALVLLLDQGSKTWVLLTFDDYEVEPVTSFFNLVLVFNEGAAFSILSDADGWQRWFFIGLGLVVSVVLLGWIRQLGPKQPLSITSLALILGGAWGNLIDRLLFGRVTDFLDFYYGSWHWPAFNVADIAISLGVLLMLIAMFKEPAPPPDA